MRREYVASFCAATLAVIAVVFGIKLGVAGPEQTAKDAPTQPGTETQKTTKPADLQPEPLPDALLDDGKREAMISKMLEAYDLKPRPLAPIPDQPPPHEGAMIGLPYIVEPPDNIMVEVLEALPGRPVSGERLVRPDGTVDLGFYGPVHVKGLTLEQVKVAIIKHLRPYLSDENLGLHAPLADSPNAAPARKVERPPLPSLPPKENFPLDELDDSKKRSSRLEPSLKGRPAIHRSASREALGNMIPLRQTTGRGPRSPVPNQEAPMLAPNQITVPVGGGGGVTITIQVDGQNRGAARPDVNAAPLPEAVALAPEFWTIVPPEKSRTVFVDVTAYNSKNYYVEGDFLVNGRMPWTGSETVLDAIHFAGGFLPSAEPKDIRLVRPARGGKPAKVFTVDYDAIRDKGDVTSNYQIFPGDRLIVGRNEVVKKTTEIDRLNAPIQSITGMIMQEAFALRSLQSATASNRDELLKEYVDFWTKAIFENKDLKFDEQTLREAFVRKVKLAPASVPGVPSDR
jgi:protein involved in polysaccharide export with SLBB domain